MHTFFVITNHITWCYLMQIAIVRFSVQFSKLVELKLYPARNLRMINELCMSCVSKLLLKELLHDKQNQIELNNCTYSFSFLRFTVLFIYHPLQFMRFILFFY